jgi:hypothetical protein
MHFKALAWHALLQGSNLGVEFQVCIGVLLPANKRPEQFG